MQQFASLSESACAALLEKYCSTFKVVSGQTCHIIIQGKEIDFRIGDVFVEYHPIMFDRAFINFDSLQQIRRAIRTLPKESKQQVYQAVEKELECQYFKQRRNILDSVPEFKECELIVCSSFEAFVEKVLRRFADLPMPGFPTLEKSFKKLRKEAKNQS